MEDRGDDVAALRVEALDGVDRAEHLRERGPRGVEVERDLLAVADEAVGRQGEPVAVHLEPVAQSRLHDADVPVDLVDQAVHVGHELVGDLADVAGEHRPEQQAAEAGSRVDREHEVAERDAAGRRQRPRAPHLELGEQHP